MVGAIVLIALLSGVAQGRSTAPATTAQNPEYPLPPPPPDPPEYLTPFPVVRLAGELTRTGVRVRLLRVKAPRSSLVTVRCAGGRPRGCRTRSQTRSIPRSGSLRFRGFERRLKAGVKLRVYVRRGNTIGKFTRFTVRRRKAPRRMDACLFPGDPFEPRGCP